MKNKFNIENDVELVKVSMMDGGHCEYVRWGVGEVDGKVFMVDLDEGGEGYEEREMMFVKEDLSVEDVCKIGVEVGVFVESGGLGYNEDDKYRFCWGKEGLSFVWDEFYSRVLK
jgi:hypothetical protein